MKKNKRKMSKSKNAAFLKCLVILLLFSALLVSCSSVRQMDYYLLEPPERLLPEAKIILLEPFTTPDPDDKEGTVDHAENFTDYLLADLNKSDRGIEYYKGSTLLKGTYTNIFDVKLGEEDRFGRGIEKAGKHGAKAMLLGTVVYSHKDVKEKKPKDPDKKSTGDDKIEKSKKDAKKKRKIVKRTVNVVVSASLVRTDDESFRWKLEEKYSKEEPEFSGSEVPSVDSMVDAGLKELSTRIANRITPYYALADLKLEKIEDKKYKKRVEKAQKLAKGGSVDGAYRIYKRIYNRDRSNYKIMYNLGILNEVVGNFQEAKEWYKKVFKLAKEQKYRDALDEIDKRLEDARQLKKIGIHIIEHVFK
ncbi:hypothetical protein ACFLRB_02775 [Acidobacteriota bacterium]